MKTEEKNWKKHHKQDILGSRMKSSIDANSILKSAYVLDLPMVTCFRNITQREVLLFEGPCGWGEFSPFLEYSDSQAALWLDSALEAAYEGLLAPKRDTVAVNVTVPALDASQVSWVLDRYDLGAAPTVKIKVAEGFSPQEQDSRITPEFRETLRRDVKRVETVIRYIADHGGTGLRFRIDANGAWSYEQSVLALETLAIVAEKGQAVFEYAEQPTADIRDMILLKKHFLSAGVLLAADEGLRKSVLAHSKVSSSAGIYTKNNFFTSEKTPNKKTGKTNNDTDAEDNEAAIAEHIRQAADVLIIKNAPLGGNRRAAYLAGIIGLPTVVSSALDTDIGLYASARLAAALPKLDYACGLNTDRLFVDNITDGVTGAAEGKMHVTDQVPFPQMRKLKEYRADSSREKWWFERVRRIVDAPSD